MSLYFTLRVNLDQSLGQVTITRVTNADFARLDPGTVSRYAVRLGGKKVGTVTHRYGDGAFALAHKALGLIVERQSLTKERT